METSLFIAQVLGPCFCAVGLGIVLNCRQYAKVIEDFTKNATVFYVTGLIPLAFGIVIIRLHNIWTADWRVIITVCGWAGLIKGLWLIVFPRTVSAVMRFYEGNKMLLMVHAVIALVIGLVLTYNGFNGT